MAKKNDNAITREELVELVELLRDRVRNDRYRELTEKYENDESLDEVINGFDDPERVTIG